MGPVSKYANYRWLSTVASLYQKSEKMSNVFSVYMSNKLVDDYKARYMGYMKICYIGKR